MYKTSSTKGQRRKRGDACTRSGETLSFLLLHFFRIWRRRNVSGNFQLPFCAITFLLYPRLYLPLSSHQPRMYTHPSIPHIFLAILHPLIYMEYERRPPSSVKSAIHPSILWTNHPPTTTDYHKMAIFSSMHFVSTICRKFTDTYLDATAKTRTLLLMLVTMIIGLCR